MDIPSLPQTDWERIKLLREEIKFEHNLMSSRLTAFVNSQSFLFAAYALSGLMEHRHHPALMWFSHLMVPTIGILFSVLLWFALAQGRVRLDALNVRLHDRLYNLNGKPRWEFADDLCLPSPRSRAQSLRFLSGVPLIVGVAWVAVGALSAWCQLSS